MTTEPTASIYALSIFDPKKHTCVANLHFFRTIRKFSYGSLIHMFSVRCSKIRIDLSRFIALFSVQTMSISISIFFEDFFNCSRFCSWFVVRVLDFEILNVGCPPPECNSIRCFYTFMSSSLFHPVPCPALDVLICGFKKIPLPGMGRICPGQDGLIGPLANIGGGDKMASLHRMGNTSL